MMTTTKFSMLAALGVVSILSGCATNNELYAKYDKTCDTPKAKVKVVERVKYVDKVKVKYVDKVRVVNKVVNKGIDGLHWEPAVYFGFNRGELNAQEQLKLDIIHKLSIGKISFSSALDLLDCSRRTLYRYLKKWLCGYFQRLHCSLRHDKKRLIKVAESIEVKPQFNKTPLE